MIAKRKNNCKIFHFDLYGKRQEKYKFLLKNNLQTIGWTELQTQAPNYFFVPKDFSLQQEYEKGFSITELFPVNSVGIVTARDAILTNNKEADLLDNVREHFGEANPQFIQKINYRPFDTKFVYYDTKLIERPREKVMQHFLKGKNLGLVCKRGFTQAQSAPIFCTNIISDYRFWSCPGMQGGDYVFPLYLYPDSFGNVAIFNMNMNEAIVKEIAGGAIKYPTHWVEGVRNDMEVEQEIAAQVRNDRLEIKIFDYIYAVLHCPAYREKYKEFLKIDFPRVPYPKNAKQFDKLAELGEKLRKLHLLENVTVPDNFANFPQAGSNVVQKVAWQKIAGTNYQILPTLSGKVRNDSHRLPHAEMPSAFPLNDKCGSGQSRNYGFMQVWINDKQYFDNVPEIAWNFYIGGYQPVQKWLKDRKGNTLEY